MIRFVAVHNTREIFISNHTIDRLKLIVGNKFEILNTIADLVSIETIQTRLARSYPTYKFITKLKRKGVPRSEETRRKIALSKIGKPRDPGTIARLQQLHKGKSIFEGRHHSEETKRKLSEVMTGKTTPYRNARWIYNPTTDREIKLKENATMPPGYRFGRDCYSIENFRRPSKKVKISDY